MTDENVLVFPADVLDTLPAVAGFNNQVVQYVRAVFNHPQTGFRPRAKVEDDPSWKQVIPYVIVRDHENRVLVYNRNTAGGESRLHGRWSLGIGGHVNDGDGKTPRLAYVHGLIRELREEIACEVKDIEQNCRRVGCLYDPSTDVGRVHFGFVYNLQLPGISFEHSQLHQPFFATPDEVATMYDRLEAWSRMVVDGLLRNPGGR